MNHLIEEVKQFVKQHMINVIIGSADKEGLPHLAMEKNFQWIGEKAIKFETWFCLTTIENVRNNPKIAIAFVDQQTQEGYQILGHIESIREGAILNGYIPGEEREGHPIFPQAYQIIITFDKVMSISSGPHTNSTVKS